MEVKGPNEEQVKDIVGISLENVVETKVDEALRTRSQKAKFDISKCNRKQWRRHKKNKTRKEIEKNR